MGLNLALAAAALAVVAQTPPQGDAPAPARPGESFVHLADELDVRSIEPPPADESVGDAGLSEPRTWSLLAMGVGIVVLFAARHRG